MNTPAPRFSLYSLSRLLWALVLVTLPVTSFRFMPFMGAGTYVRPLALYPLALLLPVLLLRLKRGEISRPWPGAFTILLAFCLAALASTAIGATFPPIELRGVDFFDRALRALVTLAIGLSFFIAAAWMNQEESDLRFSVRWLLVGLVAQLLWGAVQFVGLNTGNRQLLYRIQNLFSVRGLVKNKRISGFTYEPSWLAGQLAALYLPWLTAAVLTRYRAVRSQGVLSRLVPWVEPALLLLSLAGVLMTYSRSGLFVVLVSFVVTFLIAGQQAIRAAWAWVRAGFQPTSSGSRFGMAATRILLALVILAVLVGAAGFLADKGYIAAFFKADKTNLFAYAVDVYLGPRLAYASAALTAFTHHPISGVGLGASGFAIYQNMPDWVLAGVPEIANQMSPLSTLYPNPKNLYVRLLTETGLFGLILFLLFYMTLLADCLELLKERPAAPLAGRWLAAAGIFALTAIFLQGISQDSFAMPEMWINLGILAGAAGAIHKMVEINNNSQEKPANGITQNTPGEV